jgi:hypothetical protein
MSNPVTPSAAWHRQQAERLATAAESSNDQAATLAVALASVHAQIASLPRRAWRVHKPNHSTPAPGSGWPITGDDR